MHRQQAHLQRFELYIFMTARAAVISNELIIQLSAASKNFPVKALWTEKYRIRGFLSQLEQKKYFFAVLRKNWVPSKLSTARD